MQLTQRRHAIGQGMLANRGFALARNARGWLVWGVLGGVSLLGCGRGNGPALSQPNAPPPSVSVQPTSTDWPVWRGSRSNGISPDPAAILQWDKQTNVLWRLEIPGMGHSTPVVVGERVFLTTAVEDKQQQWVMAYKRDTGEALWHTVVHEGRLPRKHGKNSHASASPASDGERVYVVFAHEDGLFATALDFEGQIVWQEKVGDFTSEHGYGSSPALYQGRLFINGDSLKNCFIAAVDTSTGKVVWKTPRTTTGRHGSYATPVVAHLAGRDQVVLSGMGSTDAYDPQTGKLLWTVAGPAEVTACTVAFDEHTVFASGGYPEKELLAIRADGTGNVSRTHVVWRSAKPVTYVPSPLYYRQRLYIVTDNGIAAALDAATGRVVWQERLEGDFSASPVLAGEFIYASSEQGKTYVLRAADKFELVAVNDLSEPIFATPVICGGCIYVRTSRALYCLADKAQMAATGSREDRHALVQRK